MEHEIPNLEDLLNVWRETSPFADWTYTGAIRDRRWGKTCSFLQSPTHDKRGIIQVWDTYVMVIISEDTIGAIHASEHYKRYLKEMTPPGSNQWIRIEAADPEFFEKLGAYMEIICQTPK